MTPKRNVLLLTNNTYRVKWTDGQTSTPVLFIPHQKQMIGSFEFVKPNLIAKFAAFLANKKQKNKTKQNKTKQNKTKQKTNKQTNKNKKICKHCNCKYMQPLLSFILQPVVGELFNCLISLHMFIFWSQYLLHVYSCTLNSNLSIRS